MKLSIIISVKEIDEYIISCLDSIINQRCNNFEVIIIDEEYTNNSEAILSKYKDVNNIKIFNYNLTDKSLGSSLNYGLTKASGEYVMFVLANDYFEEDFLQKALEMLKDEDLFKYDFTLLDNSKMTPEKTNSINSVNGKDALKELISLKDNFCRLNKYIIKKRILVDNKINIEKRDFYSKLTIVPYLFFLANKFNNSELTGYVYRMKNGDYRNIHLDSPKEDAYEVLSKYEYLDNLLFAGGYSEEEKEIIKKYAENILVCASKKLKGRELKEFKKILKSKNIKISFLKRLLSTC